MITFNKFLLLKWNFADIVFGNADEVGQLELSYDDVPAWIVSANFSFQENLCLSLDFHICDIDLNRIHFFRSKRTKLKFQIICV